MALRTSKYFPGGLLLEMVVLTLGIQIFPDLERMHELIVNLNDMYFITSLPAVEQTFISLPSR